MNDEPHPIAVELRDPTLERNRWTVFFRLILFIPHAVWWVLWGIAIVVVLPFHWLASLIMGGAPELMHNFYGSYTRYTAHLYAYMTMAADPYPGFTGEPHEYPVDVNIAEREHQPRWTILLRLPLALPPVLLASALAGSGIGDYTARTGDANTDVAFQGGVGVITVVAILAWFVCLARGRNSPGLRDLAVYCIGYAAQAYGYFALLTARYPDSTPALARPAPQPQHPVRASLDDDRSRNRLTVFFRLLLAVPHIVWLILWGIVVFFAVVANWFATLAVGRSPEPLHRFLARYLRYRAHLGAFLSLTANPFPGFLGEPGTYPYELEIDPPEGQHRAVTLFRIILAIPALMLSSALGTAQVLAAIGGWFAALFTGRMPRGLRDLTAFCIRYDAQLNAYAYILTDRYPYSGPTLETASAKPTWEPPASPTATWTTAPEAV